MYSRMAEDEAVERVGGKRTRALLPMGVSDTSFPLKRSERTTHRFGCDVSVAFGVRSAVHTTFPVKFDLPALGTNERRVSRSARGSAREVGFVH